MTDYLIKEDVFMALTGDITDCTIEEFIARLRDKLRKLPSVGKDINVTTNEDCISRQAVVNTTLERKSSFKDDFACGFFIDKIRDLPPVKPKEKTRANQDEKMIDDIDFAIKATDSQDDYSMGMRNGMRYVKSLIDGKEPQYELRRTDEEIKLGIDLGDEVIGDYGAKGVVVGIDTYKGEVLLSLLMGNHKVPQLVKASGYKTKTSRHFPQIIEVLEQMKGEADGK